MFYIYKSLAEPWNRGTCHVTHCDQSPKRLWTRADCTSSCPSVVQLRWGAHSAVLFRYICAYILSDRIAISDQYFLDDGTDLRIWTVRQTEPDENFTQIFLNSRERTLDEFKQLGYIPVVLHDWVALRAQPLSRDSVGLQITKVWDCGELSAVEYKLATDLSS